MAGGAGFVYRHQAGDDRENDTHISLGLFLAIPHPTPLNTSSNLLAASFWMVGSTCEYVSSVMLICECPNRSWTTLGCKFIEAPQMLQAVRRMSRGIGRRKA